MVAPTDQVPWDFNMDNQDLKPKNESQEQSPTREISEAGTAVDERYVSSHPFPVTLSSSIMLRSPTTSNPLLTFSFSKRLCFSYRTYCIGPFKGSKF